MNRKRFIKRVRGIQAKIAKENRIKFHDYRDGDVQFGKPLLAGKFKGIIADSYKTVYNYMVYLMTEYNPLDDLNCEEAG